MTCDSGSGPTGRDVKQDRGEAPQSGHEVASPEPHRNPSSTPPPVTEEMIAAALGVYDTGGLSFETAEDHLRAIITAALAARSNQEATLLDGTDLRAFCERLFKATDEREIDTLIGTAAGYLEAQCNKIAALTATPVQEATRTVGDAELVERVALALGAALVRRCGGRAWADTERCRAEDTILAEVDGEIDLENLARAAIDALSHTSSCGGI